MLSWIAVSAAVPAIVGSVRVMRMVRSRHQTGIVESVHRATRLRSPRFSLITDRACDLIHDACAEARIDPTLAVRAATLRDIGLSAVPYDLLNRKALCEWTVSDRDTYRRHLAIGDDILAALPSLAAERELLQRSEAMFWLRDGTVAPSREALILKTCLDFAFNEAFYGIERAESMLISNIGVEYESRTADLLLKVLHSRSVRPVPSYI